MRRGNSQRFEVKDAAPRIVAGMTMGVVKG